VGERARGGSGTHFLSNGGTVTLGIPPSTRTLVMAAERTLGRRGCDEYPFLDFALNRLAARNYQLLLLTLQD